MSIFKQFLNLGKRGIFSRYKTKSWGSSTIVRSMMKDCQTALEFFEADIDSCVLKNGMKLVCEYKESCPIATVGCYLPAGAIYEQPEERGGALYLEHLLFRRTKLRDHCQIEEKIADIGGKICTFAMRDMFVFCGTINACDLDVLIELYADVLLNGVIRDDDVYAKKYIILNELANMELNHKDLIKEYLINIAYQDTEFTKSIYPESDVIKNFSADCLMNFRERVVNPCFLTMVSTGGVQLCNLHESVCKHFVGHQEIFDPFPGIPEKTVLPNINHYRFSGADLRLRDDDEDVGYVAIGVEAPGYDKYEEHCVLNAIRDIIGSWDMTYGGANHNAPYLAHIAYNTDICYMYESFNMAWNHTGIWGCYLVSDKVQVMDFITFLQKEWLKLYKFTSEKDLQRVIKKCVTSELMKLNNSCERFFDLVNSLARCGQYRCIQDRIDIYECITTDMIREMTDKYIYDKDPAVVAVGRIEGVPDYNLIRSLMYSLCY